MYNNEANVGILINYLRTVSPEAAIYTQLEWVEYTTGNAELINQFEVEGYSIGIFKTRFSVFKQVINLIALYSERHNTFKIYRQISDIDTVILSRFTGLPLHFVTMTQLKTSGNLSNHSIVWEKSGGTIWFCDGSGYSYLPVEETIKSMHDSSICHDEGLFTSHNQLFGGRGNVVSNPYTEPMFEGSKTFRCGDYVLEPTMKPLFGDCRIRVADSINETIAYVHDTDQIYVRKGTDWYSVKGEPVEFLHFWYKGLLKTARGWTDIRHSKHMVFGGVVCTNIRTQQNEPDMAGMVEVLNYVLPEGGRLFISATGKGKQQLVMSLDGVYMTMDYSATRLDVSNMELSGPILRPMPTMVAGYAYNSTIGKKYNKSFNQARVSAVRNTTTQVWNTEKLTYRRDNQLVINKDFTLEKLPNDDKLVEIGRNDVDGGDLYRFKFEDGDNVYAYYVTKGKSKPQPVILNEADTIIMNAVRGKASKGKLYKHCVKLAKQYDLY